MQNGQNGIRGFLGKSQMQAQNENVFIVLSVSGFRLWYDIFHKKSFGWGCQIDVHIKRLCANWFVAIVFRVVR